MIRLAGKALSAAPRLGKFLLNSAGDDALTRAMRLGPDAFFAVSAFNQTPGDFGDKLIAGGSQFIGGGLTGLTASGATRKLGSKIPALMNSEKGLKTLAGLETAADLVGSYGGDYGGMMIGDQLQRMKDKLGGGEGLNAWERLNAKEQAAFAQQLEQQILAQYGIIPGTREQYAIDPTTGMGVA